jgi:predicted ATP-grasp superfamily ATP-dependent carboligase
MKEPGIYIEQLPEQKHSLLITGFDGWGNALDVSSGMVSYLIRKLKAKYFAWINPELFYRYDENRPLVEAEDGRLRNISPPGGSFYSTLTDSDEEGIAILKASEPNLRWFQFVDEIFYLCNKLEIKTIINVGSMYDDVLHSDRIISGLASSEDLVDMLKQKNINPITYSGPGGIHSTLHAEAQKRGFQCISLWCHCPYYLQGATHFGFISQLGSLLSSLGEFELDVKELDVSWKDMIRQIKALIEENPELHAMVNGLRKAKVRGSWVNMKGSGKKNGKIIQLKDFMEPK